MGFLPYDVKRKKHRSFMKFRPRSSRVTLVKPLLRQLNAIREAGRADGIEIGICL